MTALLLSLTLISLCGCQKQSDTQEITTNTITFEPISGAESTSSAAETGKESSSEPSASSSDDGRQDGERFKAAIMLEGMDESVNYEHLKNSELGIEMDYEYESLKRYTEPGRERLISTYDDPENPWIYLEITSSPESAEAVAESIISELSGEYDITKDSLLLEHAGECILIDASATNARSELSDQLMTIYIIPASDGCRIATAHYTYESAEGFGRRFSYMMNTLKVS